MTRGIEAAFTGVLSRDPELRTSKTGKPFASLNLGVVVGQTDDGKDHIQWLRATCFGETAERIAANAKKGSQAYVEGSLSLNEWNDKATGD
jgi:single-stranded DNA-binding protein